MPEHYITLVLFVVAYALFALLPNRRSLVAVAAALLLVLFRIVSPSEALHGINWNVMGIFVGTLFAADMFIESRFPAWFAEVLVNKARSTA
jgi:Na+/H+ antiporter NhaD/arsenite permease-like protein